MAQIIYQVSSDKTALLERILCSEKYFTHF